MMVDLGKSPTGYEFNDLDTTKYPKNGFQNAPRFCEDMENSLATNVFTFPELEPGMLEFRKFVFPFFF